MITKVIIAKPIQKNIITGYSTTVLSVIYRFFKCEINSAEYKYLNVFISDCFDYFAGRVLSQSAIGTAPNTITISESGVTGTSLNPLTQQTATKIAISPLKSPNKV